jgi:hypothetical protein
VTVVVATFSTAAAANADEDEDEDEDAGRGWWEWARTDEPEWRVHGVPVGSSGGSMRFGPPPMTSGERVPPAPSSDLASLLFLTKALSRAYGARHQRARGEALVVS